MELGRGLMKIVIEITEPVDEETGRLILRQMTADADGPEKEPMRLDGAYTWLPVKIVGVVTDEDCPGDQLIMAVEPL